MGESRVCEGCGVTFPSAESACPACLRPARRVIRWRWPAALSVALVGIALIGAASYPIVQWMRAPDPLAEDVTVVPNWHTYSADGRGTDVTGTIVNNGLVMLDVWVRLKGYDAADRVFYDRVIGPFPRIGPGSQRDFRHYVDATPFKKFEQDVSRVRKSEE